MLVAVAVRPSLCPHRHLLLYARALVESFRQIPKLQTKILNTFRAFFLVGSVDSTGLPAREGLKRLVAVSYTGLQRNVTVNDAKKQQNPHLSPLPFRSVV